jgi:RHS repeat-associated protein
MKNFYFTLLFLGFSFFVSAQDLGGTPVQGLKPIERITNTTEKTSNTKNQANETTKILTTSTITPTGNSTEVGITEGQLSVSLTGGANYNIPIAVPPGINGVVPQISLAYNSQGGNGMAGYGWNISGVSVITRIPRTKFHDGVVGGVNLDSNDRFALDGQRLILKSGASYGAATAIYETESFSNIKITSLGVSPLGANYGPASFMIEYPDGSVAEYGSTTDSRSITTWSISYWQNPQGVRISYNYILENNTLSIEYIKYGSTTTNNPINQIKFVYKARQRPEQAYVGGQSILRNSILSEIQVLGNGVGFRNYNLTRETTSLGYERLKSITEKSGDGIKSYNPTVFTYETTSEYVSFNEEITSKLNLGNISSQNAGIVSGDFDGDEKMDFLIYPTTGPDAKSKYWLYSGLNSGTYANLGWEHPVGKFDDIFPVSWLSWNNKLMPTQGWTIVKANHTTNTTTFNTYSAGFSNPIYFQYEKAYEFPKFTYYNYNNCDEIKRTSKTVDQIEQEPELIELDVPKSYLSGDFNGDGLTDVIVIEKTITYQYQSGCDYSTQTRHGGQSYFVNLDRRLTADFVNHAGFITSNSNSKFIVADFNGDGKSDVYVFDTGFFRVYTLNESNYFDLLYQNTTADANIVLDIPILTGDYNGDGKTDFMIPSDGKNSTYAWLRYISTGTSFVKTTYSGVWYNTNTNTVAYNYMISDHNKDGKSDLVIIKIDRNSANTQGSINVQCYNNNGGFVSYPSSTTSISSNSSDINLNTLPVYLPTGRGIQNNGKPYYPTLEIAFLSNDKIFYFNSTKDNTKDQLLRTITTGNGVRESITYQPLSPDSLGDNYNPIYTSGYTENYPNRDIESAVTVQLVSKLEKQSTTVYKKQLFAYAGATSNLEGLGYLGFRASMRTNWFEDDAQIISSVSKFDPNLRGANVENYSYLGLVFPAITANATAPNIPRISQITISNTRTATETLLATKSIIFLPGATIMPTAGSTFVAQITPDYDSNGFSETNTTPQYNLISKSLSFYETSLSPTKVFKLQNVQSNNYNILENTSSETSTIYDGYNNPTESIAKLKNGGVSQQTTTGTVAYEMPTLSPYMVGRPKSKTQTVTSSGDSMSSKETYQYGSGSESNLLKKIEKYGNNTSAITETNGYDSFGNITQKTISASGITDRKTNYKYDPTGRFLEESTDIELLKTTFIYNPNGTLKTETNPYGLTTSYLYDSWFKKTIVTDYLGKTHTYGYVRQSEKAKITLTGDTDGSYSEELFDDLGRKIRTGVKDIQGNMSYKDFKYDIYDRNFSVSEPNTGSQLWNTTLYDVYGRPETFTDFKGKAQTMRYDKLTTTVTDGSTGQTKTSTKNVMGNVITLLEAPIGGTINYSYFANGNLKETNYNGNKITISQDGWGRKIQLVDPSAGTYTYDYNALGENIQETTPNGTTTYKLNDWGKPETKTIVGTNTNSNTLYTYDTADSKLLIKTVYTDAGDSSKIITTDYTYDSKKRLLTTTETTGYGAVFTKTITYDAWGRADVATSTASLNGKTSSAVTQNTYKNGFAYQIKDYPNTKTLWETTEVNARGQLTKAALGNGIVINNTYDSYGYVTNMKHTLGTSITMELGTDFDTQRGNLNWRKNSLFGNGIENFKYDTQDRLTEYPNALGVSEIQTYEDDGRIKTNTLGAYNYTNTAKKYQNTSITLTPEALSYYQAKPLQTVSYNTFKSPVEIVEDGIDKISFVYNDNNDRSLMFYGGLGLKETRTYRKHYSADGTMEIKENTLTGATEFVTYIGGDGYSAPIVYKKAYDSVGASQEQTLYLHRDYQGSILAITNEAGAVLEKRQFDAWGAIVKVQDGTGNTLNGLTILDRGYTGHEHLQSIGLIHMNGRLYDPKLHRFLQPDNYVQDAGNTQNYNRYGYVLNNPLKYTDPSGEFKMNWNDIIAGAAIVVGAVLVATGYGAAVGAVLIGAGVAHFGATYNEFKQTGDWNTASNNAGISFSTTIKTDWGYGSDNKSNGVTQTEPVVKPKTVDDGKEDGKNYGGDGSGSFLDYFSRFVYETDQFNPIALAWDGLEAKITGSDRYGNSLTPFESSLKIASAVPIGTYANFSESVLSHIFRDATGHVNPLTLTSRMRYFNLFENVASKSENIVPTVNSAAQAAGKVTYNQVYRNGKTVWVEVVNGTIRNAGVNIP